VESKHCMASLHSRVEEVDHAPLVLDGQDVFEAKAGPRREVLGGGVLHARTRASSAAFAGVSSARQAAAQLALGRRHAAAPRHAATKHPHKHQAPGP